MTSDRFRRFVAVCATLSLAGCSQNPHYVITAPKGSIVCSDATGVSCQVPVDVSWDGVSVRPFPETTLDGNPFTVAFQTGNKNVFAQILVPVGSHTFGVSGDLQASNGLHTYSATSPFTVTPKPPPTGSFTVSASPSTLVIERGKSATTTVTVVRGAPFTGAVALALNMPPAGITMNPASIPAGMTTATVTINASNAATHGKPVVKIDGTSAGIATSQAQVTVIVGRETGAFADPSPAPYSQVVPSTVNAGTGGFRVDISVGQPAVAQPYKANFFRGTTAVGGDIGYTVGTTSNLGGAGFCANAAPSAITRGVVMSGALPGFASQNVVMFVDVTANAPAIISEPVDITAQPTSTGPIITFVPRVRFSKDCTLALVAGVNKLGPSKNMLHVYDLRTGTPIGTDVPFETGTFSASVVNGATDQKVDISVDAGSATARTVQYSITP